MAKTIFTEAIDYDLVRTNALRPTYTYIIMIIIYTYIYNVEKLNTIIFRQRAKNELEKQRLTYSMNMGHRAKVK